MNDSDKLKMFNGSQADSEKVVSNEKNFFVEVFCKQRNHHGERICGDVFRSKRIKTEDRIIVVLSDGMGHGVKANVLATFTSSFAVNFTEEHKDFEKIADIIMNTLPINAETNSCYSTFTIVDIDLKGRVSILEYDNPQTMVIRNNEILKCGWLKREMNTEKNKGKILKTTTFTPRKGDRIVFWSDGVIQSGLGILGNNTGWTLHKCMDYVLRLISNNKKISAKELSSKVVNQAFRNDGYHSKDDTSCATIYFRDPRKTILCSGPPYDKGSDAQYAKTLMEFDGKKIVCGGTSAEIISRELKIDIKNVVNVDNFDLPPYFEMEGIDLVTEGVITLTKVLEKLNFMKNSSTELGNDPADKIISLFDDSDTIHFLVGTGVNVAHQAPDLHVDIELRRTIIKRIAVVLEEWFMKDVIITYI